MGGGGLRAGVDHPAFGTMSAAGPAALVGMVVGRLSHDFEHELRSVGMAGGVGGGQPELGVSPRRGLDAMVEGGVNFGYGRIQAKRGGAEHAVADSRRFASMNHRRVGVEVADPKSAAADSIDHFARPFGFRGVAGSFGVARPLPAAVEDPAVVRSPNQHHDAEQRQNTSEEVDHVSTF